MIESQKERSTCFLEHPSSPLRALSFILPKRLVFDLLSHVFQSAVNKVYGCKLSRSGLVIPIVIVTLTESLRAIPKQSLLYMRRNGKDYLRG
jgi:hypothetical protein